MLYLPPGVTREMLAKREEREASAFEGGVFASDDRCREFTKLLKHIDPHLSMVFCKEPAPLEAVACGARPGRYNLVRETPGSPVTFIPVISQDGGYAEPTSQIFELLKSMDWQDPRVQRDRRLEDQRLEDAKVKAEREEMRRMNEEVYEDFVARTRTQVSMNRDTAWGQNAAGAKKARGQKRGSRNAR